MRTNGLGQVSLQGWAGTYSVSTSNVSAAFELSADQSTLEVALAVDG